MFEMILKKEVVNDEKAVKIIGITFFVLATACGAFVRIPLPYTPVPITLQTMFVLLSGAVLGKKTGFISQFVYLGLGGLGMPFFTNSGALWGPTAGYIAGFVIAAYLTGHLIEKKFNAIGACIIGSAVILFFGMINLSLFVGGMKNAFLLGVLPFIAGDILKSFAAAGIFSIYKNSRR